MAQVRTTAGLLPMHFAAMASQQLEVLRFLLTDARGKSFGAEQLFARDNNGRMPIHHAGASWFRWFSTTHAPQHN
jgi:ankyrin repeat protein